MQNKSFAEDHGFNQTRKWVTGWGEESFSLTDRLWSYSILVPELGPEGGADFGVILYHQIHEPGTQPMANYNTTEAIESLASEIGENVYIDVAKWHLYLRDAHLHTTLAEKFLPLLQKGAISENQALEVLRSISVKLGGGKREVPLSDLLPMQSQVHLMDVLEEYQRKL